MESQVREWGGTRYLLYNVCALLESVDEGHEVVTIETVKIEVLRRSI